jgi:hypothetical protein
MTSPNPQQQDLIESTEGIHLVDAGAGTGIHEVDPFSALDEITLLGVG